MKLLRILLLLYLLLWILASEAMMDAHLALFAGG